MVLAEAAGSVGEKIKLKFLIPDGGACFARAGLSEDTSVSDPIELDGSVEIVTDEADEPDEPDDD